MQTQVQIPTKAIRQFIRLRVWTSAMALVLLVSTKSLWLPTSTIGFPQIPLVEWLCEIPLSVDWVLTAFLCLGLVVGCLPFQSTTPLATRLQSLGNALVLVCGAVLVALNQHRFQPWFYLLLVFYTLFYLFDRESRASRDEFGSVDLIRSSVLAQRYLGWLRAIVISVYFYSAIGKFDSEFLHTVGQQFIQVALDVAPVDTSHWAWSTRWWLACLLPLVELLLAVMLVVSLFRGKSFAWAAATCACLFHVALMAIFGWGLGHSAGVVGWNLQFAVQALLLFGYIEPKLDSEQDVERNGSWRAIALGWHSMLASCVVVAVLTLPLVERWGFWDHWPSWALYAPHSSRVEVQVAPSAISRLPADLQQLLEGEVSDDTAVLWVRIPLAKWSLESLGTPVYPQARFELGVARWLAQRVNSRFAIRSTVLGTAARWDGRRSSREFSGTDEMARAADQFFWNTRPRFSIQM